jgi:ppGpp synthetase/RelA/SpoT-type nucleotidyltranferase
VQWSVPAFTSDEVDRAGMVLASSTLGDNAFEQALDVINNFRSSHHYPLNTFQSTLRRKAKEFPGFVVVQRVKRLRAIQHKLQKHTRKPIPLSGMQDIGGCRAVLQHASQVTKLHDVYINSDLKHALIHQDNYIVQPKFSGYRGIHLVYNYKSDKKKEMYNGLKIEVQIRSQLQHAWATAVEIVGFFRKELLKSSEGDIVWKHFFKLMAMEIAFEENAPFGIPDMPEDRGKLREQLRKCCARLDALTFLGTLGQGQQVVEESTMGAHYFLLELDTAEKRLKITGYKLTARAKATMDLAAVESALFGNQAHDAVLVSAESMADLRRAYSNYYLDMHRFIQTVEKAVA